MKTFDFLDVLAVIFGVLFTLRKLETARRQPGHHPGVNPGEFLAWKAKQESAYALGSTACFLKLLLGFLFGSWVLSDGQLTRPEVLGAVLIDGGWAAALILSWRRRSAALRLAESLNIRLGPIPPSGQ